MFIESIDINQRFARSLGLQQACLNGFGQLVILAGPNGSGKSRLLSMIEWSLEQGAALGYERIQELRAKRKKGQGFAEIPLEELDMQPYTYTSFLRGYQALDLQGELYDALGMTFALDEDPDLALRQFMEVSEFLKRHPENMLDNSVRLSMGQPRPAGDFSRTGLLASPLAYVKDVCLRALAESRLEEDSLGTVSLDRINNDVLEALRILLHALAGLSLTANDAQILVNSIPVEQLALSDGQNQLLRWAVLIHSRKLEKLRIPILIDEPEQHLHPEAVIKLLDMLMTHAPEAQFWIATHSLPLIAHLAAAQPRAVWCCENGQFSRARGDFARVTQSLFGGQDGPEKLADFCAEPERFALRTYAAECLIEPVSLPFKANDPQLAQIWARLNSKQDGKPLAVVDFGAGKARLLDGLAEQCEAQGKKLSEVFSYFALEITEVTRLVCAQRVARHYDDDIVRVFATLHDAHLELGAASIDVVVLSNVLHEIELKYWRAEVFGDSSLYAMFAQDGVVLVVEDTELPIGELAHEFGYLILDSQALAALFGIDDIAGSNGQFASYHADRHHQRLQATVIAQQLLKQVSDSSIMAALILQKRLVMERLRTLRVVDPAARLSYMEGRKHAFLAHHLTNLTLALEYFPAPQQTV